MNAEAGSHCKQRAQPYDAAGVRTGESSRTNEKSDPGTHEDAVPRRIHRQAMMIGLPLALMAVAPLFFIDLRPIAPHVNSYLLDKRSIPLPSVARALLPGALSVPSDHAGSAVSTPPLSAQDEAVSDRPLPARLGSAVLQPAGTDTVDRFELTATRSSLMDLILADGRFNERLQHVRDRGPASVSEIEGFDTEFGD